MLALALLLVMVVYMCALAAAAVLSAAMLCVLGLASASGLARQMLPRRPTHELSLDDLRLSNPAPARWRL